ncbi:MAG TPA: hypothetical protein VF599_00920 [Pyrinomonadaceae bacterium]|jgi:hypothetical protein
MEDNGKTPAETSVGEMHKRREAMADERRYIIYYTFGNEENSETMTLETSEEKPEESKNV